MDVMTTMLDENVPWTAFEYEEWGDPHDKTLYDYMTSYWCALDALLGVCVHVCLEQNVTTAMA